MSDAARIPCCITGCRRTFKAEVCGDDHDEIMCGRHFKCDADLLRRLRSCRRRCRWIERRLARIDRAVRARSGQMLDKEIEDFKRLAEIKRALWRRDYELWGAIKAEAQRQQDAGFFVRRRPRRKPSASLLDPPGPSAGERLAMNRFEAEFHRLKRVGARA